MTSMIDPPSDSQPLILKTDTRGRVFTPLQRRESLLDEFERSGLSGAKFAALSGIKYQTFANWIQKRRRQRGQGQPVSKPQSAEHQVSWLEAVVQEAQGANTLNRTSLVLHLPGGVRAEIDQPQHVRLAAALVRALQEVC